MGSSDLTDGTWLWPEGLAHYVRKHDVVLPEEFIAHVVSRAPQKQPEHPEDIDTGLWTRWCAVRRARGFLDGLRAARAVTQARVLADRAARLTALSAKGVSEETCIWKNCKQKALVGARVCAEHYLSPSDTDRLQLALHTDFRDFLVQFSRDTECPQR
jgi:hypothetical protein